MKDIYRLTGYIPFDYGELNPDFYNAPVVFEKYPDPSKTPLKSDEVAPGVKKFVVGPKESASKIIDRSPMYLGRDGKYYPTWEATLTADELWRQSMGLVKLPEEPRVDR